jgi:hypothetical protein
MLGLSCLPIPFIIHETGLTAKEVKAAREFLEQEGFAYYHEETEFVYVPAMATWQIGEMKETDNKVRGVHKQYQRLLTPQLRPHTGCRRPVRGKTRYRCAVASDFIDKDRHRQLRLC